MSSKSCPTTQGGPGRRREWRIAALGSGLLLSAAWGIKALFFDEHCSIRAGVDDSFYAISPDGAEILVSGYRRCTRGPLLPDPSGWSGVSEKHCLIPGTCRVTAEPWYWHVDLVSGQVTGFSIKSAEANNFLCRRWPFAGPRGRVFLFTLPNTLPDGSTVTEDPAVPPSPFRPCAQYTRQPDGTVVARQRVFGGELFTRGLPVGWRYEYTTGPVLRLGTSGAWLEVVPQGKKEDRQGMPILHGGSARVSPAGR